MITTIPDRERTLQAEVDRLTAELARLRAVEPVVWKHDCAGLCTNDVELWIDACPHCGKPRAAPPAQPAEPVQRLSDERDAFEAWMSEDGQFPKAIERDRNGNYLLSTAANAWRVWQAAIESALQTKATK